MFLSAGLDSSVIASSLARLGAGAANVRALSVSFPDNPARDEAGVAEETAARLGLGIERLELRGDPSELRREAMGTLDEPLAYSAVATQAAVSRLASKAGMKVVLSGDGGDEVFGGYRWYEPELPGAVRRPGFLDLRGQLKARDRRMGDAYRAQSWHITHAQRVFPAMRADQASRLVGGLQAEACAELAIEALRRHDAPDLPDKRRAQRIDLMTFCADVVLPKVDRAGMAYGVEARPPLLDHRIVEWGLSRPVTEAHDARPKQALRDLLAARGLSHVLDLPKRGFSLKMAHRYDRRLLGRQADVATRGAGFERNWRRVLFSTGEAYGNKLDTLALFGEWMEQQEPFGGMA
jgi:asparagine synthase (glutamine-hydrolysing)